MHRTIAALKDHVNAAVSQRSSSPTRMPRGAVNVNFLFIFKTFALHIPVPFTQRRAG